MKRLKLLLLCGVSVVLISSTPLAGFSVELENITVESERKFNYGILWDSGATIKPFFSVRNGKANINVTVAGDSTCSRIETDVILEKKVTMGIAKFQVGLQVVTQDG